MTFKINVRVTSKARCQEGYYLVMNGQRLHFKGRTVALENLRGWIALQRIQICTVREYQQRNAKKIAARMPGEGTCK